MPRPGWTTVVAVALVSSFLTWLFVRERPHPAVGESDDVARVEQLQARVDELEREIESRRSSPAPAVPSEAPAMARLERPPEPAPVPKRAEPPGTYEPVTREAIARDVQAFTEYSGRRNAERAHVAEDEDTRRFRELLARDPEAADLEVRGMLASADQAERRR